MGASDNTTRKKSLNLDVDSIVEQKWDSVNREFMGSRDSLDGDEQGEDNDKEMGMEEAEFSNQLLVVESTWDDSNFVAERKSFFEGLAVRAF